MDVIKIRGLRSSSQSCLHCQIKDKWQSHTRGVMSLVGFPISFLHKKARGKASEWCCLRRALSRITSLTQSISQFDILFFYSHHLSHLIVTYFCVTIISEDPSFT